MIPAEKVSESFGALLHTNLKTSILLPYPEKAEACIRPGDKTNPEEERVAEHTVIEVADGNSYTPHCHTSEKDSLRNDC